MNQKTIQPGWCNGCNPDNCSGCATPAAPAQVGKYPELPEWSKQDDLGGLVPSEVRQALHAYADETCEARAAAASKPQVKEARERRRWLSDSFNRGAQTLDEATVSARAMAASMLVPRAALATPAQAAAPIKALTEAIAHAEDKAKGGSACAMEHAKLAAWLTELQLLRADRAARGAAQSAPVDAADPLQGAANWLAEAHGQFSPVVLSGCLMIGYNRAKRLHDAALAARKQGATQ